MKCSGRLPALHRSLLAIAAAGLLLLPAYGFANDNPVAGTATAGVTKTQITIGATVPLTGPAAPGYDEIAPAMNAMFKWVNAHGGVYGRTIKYIYLNDKYNPHTTVALTRKLVLRDHIFADVGSFGTPTNLAIQKYLSAQKIPHIFIESGCDCWSTPKYPEELGWQPPYSVDGKILGYYIEHHLTKKVGELYQDTEFGQDVMRGINVELPASQVVGQQTYRATTLSGALTTQMAALKASGAQVVAMATVPAATSMALLAAAEMGYMPQYVLDNMGADAPTVGSLLSSLTTAVTHTKKKAEAATSLLNGVITNLYQPPEGTSTNEWIKVEKKILQRYTPTLWRQHGVDGNIEYGEALAYTFVQALEAAGKYLTRTSLMHAIDTDAKRFSTPAFVPLDFSKTRHYGYMGSEVVELTVSAGTFTTPEGTWPGTKVLSPVYATTVGDGPVRVYHGAEPAVPTALRNYASRVEAPGAT